MKLQKIAISIVESNMSHKIATPPEIKFQFKMELPDAYI